MRYLVRKSIVRILGKLWMPCALAATDRELSHYDVENIRARLEDHGGDWRAALLDWLGCNAGDFSSIVDFSASLEVGDDTVDVPWASDENEMSYLDCLYPPEEEDASCSR